MKKRILLTNSYKGVPLEIIKNEIPRGFEYISLAEQSLDALKSAIESVDYILAGGRLKITREILQEAKNLKMIQRTGVGLDAFDLGAIKEFNIPLYVNQGINAESVAEHALMLILASLRRLSVIDFNTKNGIWKKQEQGVTTHELRGKVVGLVGMGNIARTLVRLLKGFDISIIYSDINRAAPEFEAENDMRFVNRDELFRRADIISLHCPLTNETRHIVNTESISTMKDGVIIVNTARGPLINATDLCEALQRGKVAFAGLDVHEEEPITEEYLLLKEQNIILTPHIAGVTYESFSKMMHDAMRNIEIFEKGEFAKIEQYRYKW